MRTVAVIGASLAGLGTARALRDQGYDGELVIVGAEHHRPYDRPPLSKDFLKGAVTAEQLALGEPAEYDELGVRWMLGRPALSLDPRSREITLRGGERVRADGFVVATGAAARTLPGTRGLAGVHTLRTLDDAEALRADLLTGTPGVVIVGAGFIGAEVASTARHLGLDVTVVEALDVPLERPLGRRMGEVCAALHADHGVRLLCGAGVAEFVGADGRVTGVRLADGRLLPADVVLVGVGARPATAWLAGSGVLVDDGVVCDAGGATTVPGVVAAGDVARYPGPFTGHARTEHWSGAVEQARTAARTLLTGVSAPGPATAPYFWSDQYRVRVQLAGHVAPGDEPHVIEGDVDSRCFVAEYRRGAARVAVLAMNRPKPFNRLRRTLVPATADAVRTLVVP